MSLERIRCDPRVTVLRDGEPDLEGRCVVYWMQRSQRALDNPALETAVGAANLLSKPVLVFFRLVPNVCRANWRHYHFLMEGLVDLAEVLERRKIGFVLRPHPDADVVAFCEAVRPCLLISDDDPLRQPRAGRLAVAARVRPPFWIVDADAVVPSRLLLKEQYAARTIRPRLRVLLDRFLTTPGNSRPRVPWRSLAGLDGVRADVALLERLPIDRSVGPVSSFRGGTGEAQRALRRFVRERLDGYAERRNHPEDDGTSQLSPYLRFGHIGPHTIARAVSAADNVPARDRGAFLEQLIVRRELAINFVRFNRSYDRLDSAEPWARRTLAAHADDARPYRYSAAELERAETHDPLWNAAQKQMVLTGWMHNYLRMYWAKKILEWSPSAAEAYERAMVLNDRYELDGRDPNGYAGIAWAIGGKHDRAWGPARPIYGMVRYMSYASTARKFDSKAFIAQVQALEASS